MISSTGRVTRDLVANDSKTSAETTGVIPVTVVPGRQRKLVRLLCVAGADLGRTFILGDSLEIGRGAGDAVLAATDISRRHARVTRDGERFFVEDLGSSNGTFVNGAAVHGKHMLAPGDRIQMGTTMLVFGSHDELEQRMAQLVRVESMTTFASGLAHDFNNTLGVIMGNLELVKEDSDAEGQRELIADALHAAAEASRLARQLMRMGNPDPITHEFVKLDGLLDRALAFIRRPNAQRHISIVVNTLPAMTICGSAGELHQVLLNLFLNARDAMPNGGTLTITAETVALGRARALALHLPCEGSYVQLDVTDTGGGMDDTTLARAFDPFFTTKPRGSGTGLGLAMIHCIVRNHGGSVVVHSTSKSGTTFRLLLPTGFPAL